MNQEKRPAWADYHFKKDSESDSLKRMVVLFCILFPIIFFGLLEFVEHRYKESEKASRESYEQMVQRTNKPTLRLTDSQKMEEYLKEYHYWSAEKIRYRKIGDESRSTAASNLADKAFDNWMEMVHRKEAK